MQLFKKRNLPGKKKRNQQQKHILFEAELRRKFGAPENYFGALFILRLTFSQWAVMSKAAYCFLIDYLLK